jgi:DNA-binding transcriptional LysR family regulator
MLSFAARITQSYGFRGRSRAINLRQLEAFQAVMETGSVTRAAASLRISQPAVSKLMAGLARDCGFALFERRGNRLIPTAEALFLSSEVNRVFVSTDQIARHVANIRELRSGRLSIVAFPALATRALPRFLTAFVAEHPQTNISLLTRSSPLLVDWVAAQQADVGIGLMNSDSAGVACEPVGSFDGVCVLPPGHRLAEKTVVRAGDLDGESFISLGMEDRSRFRVDQAFERSPARRRLAIEAHQSEAACAFVAAGAGVAVVEPFSAAGFDRRQIVVKRFRPVVTFDMWLIFPAHRPRSKITDAFAQSFRGWIRTVSPFGGSRERGRAKRRDD